MQIGICSCGVMGWLFESSAGEFECTDCQDYYERIDSYYFFDTIDKLNDAALSRFEMDTVELLGEAIDLPEKEKEEEGQ